jgi:hypothetical protein
MSHLGSHTEDKVLALWPPKIDEKSFQRFLLHADG